MTAIAARQEAEERLREVLATQDAQKASQAPPRPTHDPQTTRRPRKTMPTTEQSAGGDRWTAPSAWATGEIRSVRGGNRGMVEAGLAEAVPVEATQVQGSRNHL